MQQRQWSKWSTIASSVREAHPRCAARNCFSGGIFGLPFLGQTWKKALWGLARRSEPLSARLTRNTSLASGRLTRRTVLHEASAILHGATAAAARVLKAARTAPPAAFSSRETSESRRCSTVGGGRFLSRPLPNCDANEGQREQKERTMVTGAARRGRGRWRRVKSRRKLERTAKNQGADTMARNESVGCDPPDKLLLSALKYWEVERDLIEERVATMRSATATS
jgi:hypothetical protein